MCVHPARIGSYYGINSIIDYHKASFIFTYCITEKLNSESFRNDIFTIEPTKGLHYIGACKQPGFHTHDIENEVFLTLKLTNRITSKFR